MAFLLFVSVAVVVVVVVIKQYNGNNISRSSSSSHNTDIYIDIFNIKSPNVWIFNTDKIMTFNMLYDDILRVKQFEFQFSGEFM